MSSVDLKFLFIQLTEDLKQYDAREDKSVFFSFEQLKTWLPLDKKGRCDNADLSAAYQAFLSSLLKSDVLNYHGRSKSEMAVIEIVFLQAMHVDSLFILVKFVKELNPSYKLNVVLNMLQKFVVNGSLEEMIRDQCDISSEDITLNSIWKPVWEQLVTVVASLPNRVSNKNLNKYLDTFETDKYANCMSDSLFNILQYVFQQLQGSQNVSLKFASLLFGKLCLSGFGNDMFRNLIPKLLPQFTDFLWKKVIQKFFLSIPDKFIESVFAPLLLNVPWYGYLECLIGNGGVDNYTMKYLLTKKFIFIHFFESPDILVKCIGYLATSSSRQDSYITVFQDLLDIWGKSSALKHQSEMQHFYLSCGLMISGAFLQSINLGTKKDTIMKCLLQGIQTHIENSSSSIRTQGMIIGQSLSKIIDPEGPKLSFEFEENEESRKLSALLKIPPKPETLLFTITQTNKIIITSETKLAPLLAVTDETLDSDDDLEPFDQSNDTPFYKEKVPVYVQDIIDGLVDHSKPEFSRLCLSKAHKIVRSQPHYTVTVCEELGKILLHLEDTFAADNFISARFQAMVALTVVSPEKAARYFTEQFYDRNYNIRQRLDILEVLAAASQELSQCKIETSPSGASTKEATATKITQSPPEHWSDIIQKRIDAKTRRFGKGRTREIPEPIANRFGCVAGAFFFPLLKYYDSAKSTLDLLGDDNFVLGRLIYTLGIICNSAANTLILRQMAKAMLDFIWTMRYHSEAFVRQSLLFSLCMVLVNVPAALLLQEFESDIVECQLWLKYILEKDANKECQDWAKKILILLFNIFKDENEMVDNETVK